MNTSVPCLAPKTRNAFLNILTNNVKKLLAADIKSANYFWIIFDSKYDISHSDHMSEVIRYVRNHSVKVKIRVEVREVFK